MTKRERYLKALRNEKVDCLVWAPNFDYWLRVNTDEGTLPEKYHGMSRNDIVRAIGGYIWNRQQGIKTVYDRSVIVKHENTGDCSITEMETPIGVVRCMHRKTEGEFRSRHLSEHFIKSVDDIRVMKYIAEAMEFEPDYEPTLKALGETGQDGVILNGCFSVPFIQFAKIDAGYMNAFYLWVDYRKEVDELLNVYFRKYLEAVKILADGYADIIATGDNMDGVMITPKIFKEYAVPYYQECKKILSEKGKIFEGHWCGRTENLLPLVPGCGLDVVEAIVTAPMANITLKEALDILDNRVVLQGGIPSVLVCKEGGTKQDFIRYINEVIVPLKERKSFILGMSDNVPPNADFERVEMVSKLIS
ncbi:MAG TPA: uroporphyrinogen decarboxylase family protein [bacterium]|nr:uroporphyrinogen decarboxylase family protein [bacterium]HPP08732.1 uroporphyrinogen decarboxylase family protein [bacterium]